MQSDCNTVIMIFNCQQGTRRKPCERDMSEWHYKGIVEERASEMGCQDGGRRYSRQKELHKHGCRDRKV